MYLVMEAVGSHEFFWDYTRMDHDLFCLIHPVVEVEIHYIRAHVVEDYVKCEFIDM